jgi:hypothetical protein
MSADRDDLKSIMHGVSKRKPDPVPDHESDTEEGSQKSDQNGEVALSPCGMVVVKGCRAIDVERGAEPVVSFQYVYLAVKAECTPTKFWVEFVGETTWRLTVEGRKLRALYDRLQDHCLRRIRRVERDFLPDDGKPVVTGIRVEEVMKEKD